MRVLVTRPMDDAHQTAEVLAKLGHEAVLAPLFSIQILDGPSVSFRDTQAIFATSGNGVRGLVRRTDHRDVPLFAVGYHTANIARSLGFTDVVDARGDWAALLREARLRLRPESGSLLIAAGSNASPDISLGLQRAGFHVRTCVVYETIEASNLPEPASKALRSEILDAALFFSPHSARLLAKGVREAHLSAACRRLISCCISDATARALDGLEFLEIRVAERPDHAALVALLGPGLPSRQ